jgi:hypothetical protein
LTARLKSGDTVTILPSMAGGRDIKGRALGRWLPLEQPG